MSDHNNRESELVLPPGIFAYILDKTKGNVTTYAGPLKVSLSQTDQPVKYDHNTRRFNATSIEGAQLSNISAKQGEYIVLKNTAAGGVHPDLGKSEVLQNNLIHHGTTEIIPGPISFPLWPGQHAEVIEGHHLRSNQYLLIRVIDDEAARKNWDTAVLKTAVSKGDSESTEDAITEDTYSETAKSLFTGKLMIVKGTDVSFYIPPTGVEVIKDNSNFVRDAVTLERLEYCMLLNEDGHKRYVKGPEVVFTTPTEEFVTSKDGKKRKFRAYELNDNSGLYIKVIADYTENGKNYVAGDELFITGKDQSIYFPREEHAIIKYGDQEKHYAVAIPTGESRYVLNRDKGSVDLIEGPTMFLADPRKQVLVRRVLDEKTCKLYYPGNTTILEHNRNLSNSSTQNQEFESFSASMEAHNLDDGSGASYTRGFSKTKRKLADSSSFGDELTRGESFTPPRTITLDTKLDGAVTVDVWTGFAVQVVNKSGNRRVVQGPQTVTLQYDEYLERLSLSKGTPKNKDNILQTVYLRVMSNQVSDRIVVRTKDLVDVTIDLKYLVKFNGEEENWFNVENYVQYLCDHMRSHVWNHVQQISIQDFHANATEILRDLTLGKKTKDGRTNRFFDENGMEIYDLEISKVHINNSDIAELLSTSRQTSLRNSIEVEREKMNIEHITVQENAKRVINSERALTQESIDKADLEAASRKALHTLEYIKNQNETELLKAHNLIEIETKRAESNAIALKTAEADKNSIAKFEELALKRRIEQLSAEAEADEMRAKAVQPALIEALTAIAKTGSFKEVATALAPLSIVKNESLGGTLQTLLQGTGMEHLLDNVANIGTTRFTGTDGPTGLRIDD